MKLDRPPSARTRMIALICVGGAWRRIVPLLTNGCLVFTQKRI